jgi:endonuclease/exonuclease/phosphatase family metal-dependent hydrolase
VLNDTFQHSIFEPEGPNSTWNGFKAIVPDQRIDFIFTSASVKVQTLRILTDQREGRFPSDHLPVVSEIELPRQ